MKKLNKTVSKILFSGILLSLLLLVGSCENWMSNDNFMEQIESEVHDANAAQVSVYVRYANNKMGNTEPSGNTSMKVDVPTRLSAVTSDDYGFVKWAAFSTNDFPTDKQHSSLSFITEEDYNEKFKVKELPDSVVHFSNPTNPATEVKILASRNDIFIIPIVANRPSYSLSVPANADNNVVKNTSIRILFTKAIDKNTLKDSEGNVNFSITTSTSIFTEDDNEIEAKDITDLFDYTLSDSGKMLTLKLKEGELFDNRQRITVTLLEGLCDRYGFAMNGNYTFSFQTGTNTDSLAPMIEVLYGGTGDICDVFVSFHEGEIDGKATDAAKKAPTDINDNEYTDQIVAQRIYDKLNIYVKANDIIASGNVDINPAKDLSEDNVALIFIAAGLYIDADGKPITLKDSTTTISKKNYTYISGTIDPNAQISRQFIDVVPGYTETDKDGKETKISYTGGTIYTYDVSSLPDGLIRIDVWAGDMTGNAGGPDDKGAPYYTKHDNSFKSIFVVKDTTPIDSAEVKAKKKVISNSAKAPYYWYNKETLNTMELFDSPENKIHDAGHAKLRALDKNLWWTFRVGDVSEKIAANDSSWKRIHDETDGTSSIHYSLKDAKAPSKDGPVDITLYLKDDLGNMSEPVLLDSIMYDNTAPSVTLKSGKGDFVNATTGIEELHASDLKVIEQILKVTIDESNENETGSGIRRMEIHVKKGNEEVEIPLDASTLKVLYAPSSIANPTPSSEGIRTIKIQNTEADSATTNNIKVFDVTDADKITNGTLFIYGLTLGDADGTYEVNVDLYDSALNKTPVSAITKIARDTTEPVINKVQVLGAKARKVYNQEEETWWLPYDQFEDANNLTKVTLKISANESGSGLKYIKLADNAEFTENTILYVGDTALTRDEDYWLYTSTRTIELKDWYTPKLINPTNGEHIITLENIKLNNINAPAGTTQGNKIHLTLDDFVEKSKSNDNQIYYDETTSKGTLVYADSIAPKIAYLHIADSVKHTDNNPDDMGYNGDNYTDNQNVVLTLTFADTESGNKGSGINQVILSDNAEFTSGTKIYYKNADNSETLLTTPKDYEITTDTVTFKKVFTETDTLRFTNVKIVSDIQGEQSIKADVQDFAGIKSAESKPANVIIYDSVNPSLYQVYWVADDNTVTAGNANGNVINNQTLRIEFTEETAGVKVIQLDIKQNENDTSYETPFDSSSLTLSYEYAGTKDLTKGVDYEVQGKYIILNKTYTSGAFNIKGITLKNAVDEVSYTVNVTLLDASENKDSNSTFIAIDITAPEFTDYIRIPDLKRTVELIPSGTSATVDGYWLAKTQVNGSNKAADNIPVYIKIREKSSGIKVIEFAENAILSSDTTLWLVDGTSETQVNSTIYTVDTNTNKITIKDEADSRRLFARADDSEFELLVKNVGFNKADSENEASYNTIKAYLSDVAKMRDENGKTTAEPGIYTDSRAPNAPTDLTLKDRKTTSTTIAASDGYTDESVIDMTFNLDDSEQFGSGYHQFVLDGATFIKTGADATTLKLKDINGIEIPNVDFEISSDNRTLTLKRTNQASETYTVVRQAVTVELKNIELDKPTANENHTVSVTAYDLTGWSAETVSAIIMLDTEPPVLEKPVFTAAFTREGSAYNASLNVYPHPDGENGKGVSRTFGEKTIPTFYTKAKVDDNDPTYNVVLGIRAKDNIILRGNESSTTFLYYIEDNSFSKNVADILAGEKINPETGINGNRAQQTCLWFKFPVGKYSAVIADEAGNISSVFRFNVESDDTVPAVNDFAEHVLFERPNDDSDVYRNAVPASTAAGEFTYSTETPSTSLVSRKYVTKKSGDKYRIVLNLGNTYTSDNTSAIVKKLDGADAADALNYAELSAAVNQAPIEKYAIVTNYTTWPSSTDATDYAAVIPDLTDTLWHNYTASQKVTDSGNSIVSWIDSNKNLVLELPNTQSTAPITVLVRDGCGNYNSVLLGYDSTSKTAVSYIVDGKLGTKAAENGTITEPVIIQNPYMTTPNNSSDRYTWKNADDNTETVYDWNAQSGNTDKSNSGVGQKRGFIKDFVKKATYYNPALNTNPFKIGLVLRVSTDNQETVLFNESGKTTDSTDYTARAMIYCTIDESVPTRQTIINATSQSSGVTGFNTGWVNVKAKQNEDNKIVILLDYPTPDYTTLGWTVNETNGEPKPYFIWYLFEDRIGNYEIAKVVNSAGSGTDLNKAYDSNSSLFDRWMYDGEAPKLTIRGTTTDPSTITADNINDLVATNNGFVPYVKSNGDGTSTVYVHASLSHSSLQSGATQNTNIGNGTIHKIHSNQSYSVYNPFLDLDISELTGVRAFAWTTSSASNYDFPTSSSYYGYSDGWVSSSTTNYWYTSYATMPSITLDIGKDISYDSHPELAYYCDSDNYKTKSGSQNSKYSGVKVSTVIPYGKISSANELWLHVMDWTGNISHYRMGQNIKFVNDSTAPSYSSTTGEDLKPNQYYMKKNSDSEIPLVRFAGTGADAVAGNDIKVYLPENYFTEAGSGVKGYSFKADGTGIAKRDTNGLYLSVPYDTYHKNDDSEYSMPYYVYDNVGNRVSKTLRYVFDNAAPSISSVSLVVTAGNENKFCDAENGIGTNDAGWDDFSSYRDYTHKDKNSANTPINKPHDAGHVENGVFVEDFESEELQEIYLNKTGIARFHINLTSVVSDLVQIRVNKWVWKSSSDKSQGGEWKTYTGYKRATENSEWSPFGDASYNSWSIESNSMTYKMGADNATGYNLTYDAAGTYYQILVSDISGNSSCQYFKLYLDNQAPKFSVGPTIENTIGSINKDSDGVGRFFAKSGNSGNPGNPLKINFTLEDGTGVGSKYTSSKLQYYYRYKYKGSFTQWYSMGNSNSKQLDIVAADAEIEFIEVRDMFGEYTTANVNTTHPKFKYVYGTGATDSMEFDKIMNYQGYTGTLPYSAKAKSWYYDYSSWGWKETEFNSDNCSSITGGIKFKNYDLSQVQLNFTKPEGIIGFIETEPVSIDNIGAYSNKSLGTSFEYNLPLAGYDGNDDPIYDDVTKTYYAIDYTGKATAVNVKFSYTNPNVAKNIEFVAESSGYITNNLKTKLENDNIILTSTLQKGDINYYRDGYVVVRCTFPAEATSTYGARPKSIQLYDGKGKSANALQEFKYSDGSLKYYTLGATDSVGEGTNKRYYCYLVFNIGEKQNGKTLYATITGEDGTGTAKTLITPSAITWKRDNTAPVIENPASGDGGPYWETDTENSASGQITVKKLLNYTMMPSATTTTTINSQGQEIYTISNFDGKVTIATAKDSEIGPGGTTNLYENGNVIYYRYRKNSSNIWIKDTDSDLAYYKFVATEAESGSSTDSKFNATASRTDSGWLPIKYVAHSTLGGHYEFKMPDDITTPHVHLALFLMDGVGNISEPYYLGNNTNKQYQWWLVKNKAPGTVTITDTSNETPAFTSNGSYELNVSLDTGVQIEKITAENATVKKVEFNGYDGTRWSGDPKPTYNKEGENAGYFANKELWVNVAGLKVTLDVTQDWTAKTVNLKINDADPVKVFDIEAKTLSENDVEIGTVDWDVSKSTYEISITLKNGAVPGNITKITPNKGSVSKPEWQSQGANATGKITLSGLPAKDWSSQTITLTVNDNTNITKDVLTIPATLPEEIEIGTKDWVKDQKTYSIPITLKNGAVPANITSVSSTVGTPSNNINWNDDNKTGTITLSDVPAKDWIEQVVTIKLNDRDDLKKDVFTIPAIEESDITLSGDTTCDTEHRGDKDKIRDLKTKYDVIITVPGNREIKDVTATNTDNFNCSSDNSTAEITVYPNWTEKTISLIINWEKGGQSGSFTKEVFTVGALVNEEIDVTNQINAEDSNKRNLSFNVPADRAISAVKLIDSNGNEVPSTIASHNLGDNQNKSGQVTFIPRLVAKRVYIMLNNDSNFIYEVGATPERSLANSDLDISCSPATWSSENNEYTVTIGIKEDGAPLSLITNVEAINADKSWNAETGVLTLSNITQDWTDKEVKIKVNALDPIPVFPVSHKKLTSDNILITAKDWASGTTDYELDVALKDGDTGLDIGFLEGMTFTCDKATNVTFDKDNSIIKLEGVSVTQNWNLQTVDVSISGDYIEGTDGVTKTALNVDRKLLTNDDFVISCDPATWSSENGSYTVTITINDGGSPADLITSVTAGNDNANVAWDSSNPGTVTLSGISQGWGAKAIQIKVNELEPKTVFTVRSKKLTADNIILDTPATWNGTKEYRVGIKLQDGEELLSLDLLDGQTFSASANGSKVTPDKTNKQLILEDINVTQTWDPQTITVSISGNNIDGEVTKDAINVAAKTFDANCVEVPTQTWPEDGKWTQASFNIKSELPITDVVSKDTSKFTVKVNSKWSDDKEASLYLALAEGVTSITKADLVIQVQTAKGNADIALFPNAPGAANNPRSIFGIRSGAIAYNSTATENAGDAPKTRRVSLISWVSDLFNNDSEVAAETVKDEVKSTTAKAAKKAKKAQKAAAAKVEKAPVEKPVVTETVETVAVTSAAVVSEVVETVVETVADEGTIATVEEAVPEAKVSMTAVDASVTESVADDQAQSGAILWLALAALCAAVVGIVVLFLKNRAAKK